MKPPLLEVRGLVKHYDAGRQAGGGERRAVRALDGVSFSLERGETLGLVGESGSGKSTLARTVVGLEAPTAGSVRLDGLELASLTRRGWLPHRRRLQMVFQDPYASLDPRQRVLSILAEPLAIHRTVARRQRRARVLTLLEAVGLSPRVADLRPDELSGGQRQRVALARALALEPEIVILDEPVSALDVSVQAQIVNLLADLQRRFQLAYLFVAHDLALVRHLCDRVAVLYLGRIVESADCRQLFGDPRHPYTRALLDAAPLLDPELEARRERRALPGEPPSPLAPPSGCAFHPRCTERAAVAGERCRIERPELAPVGAGRLCACHLQHA
ncbi:MAG TPA: oligopeptide/dipeptide ABC transporter ATP-binding protein [Planctomycetota bacterium]|nr:oligopeptide/dipeptide ABC transporter ATP-binding protein [Planctomycetota bacterium]